MRPRAALCSHNCAAPQRFLTTSPGEMGYPSTAHFADEGHDYGTSKRMAAYPFFARHLGLDLKRVTGPDGAIDESFFVPGTQEQMMVFDGNYPDNAVKPNTPLP